MRQTYTARDLRVAPIAAVDANRLVQRVHYSHKTVKNAQLHLGVFLGDKLEGVMQFGPSLDKRKLKDIVRGTKWNEFIELNRMAFSERLPRNSESRALGVALRLMRKQYPHLQWVVSFADGTQCGDGTIYRAAGFVLTQIKKNTSLWEIDGAKFTNVGYRTGQGVRDAVDRMIISKTTMTSKRNILQTRGASMRPLIAAGAKPLVGYQLRYVYFLHPGARARLAKPALPFSAIDAMGARMYKGQKPSSQGGASKPDDALGDQPREGGSTPTAPLHIERENVS